MDFQSPDPRLEHIFDIRINFKDRWNWGPIHPGGPTHGYTSVGTGIIITRSASDCARFLCPLDCSR